MDKWNDNTIQFPRLLAEISACGLTDEQKAEICDLMDLRLDELYDLFDRATTEFDAIKANL